VNELVRVCAQETDDLASLRSDVLGALRRLVSFDAAFMASADPETMLFTSAFAEEPLAAAAPRFLDNEFADAPDVNRFVSLAAAADPVASIDFATRGERSASTRFRELISPLGMGDEARLACRIDGSTWAFLCLHRIGATGFAAEDLAMLRAVAPHIGEAVRRVVSVAGSSASGVASVGPGVVLVVDDVIAALDDGAAAWLPELEDAGDRVAGHATVGDPVPLALRAVVRRLESLERGGGGPAAVRVVARNAELVTLHATRLRGGTGAGSGAGVIAVTIGPTAPTDRVGLLLSAHGLTPAQRRVAQLVLRGLTTRQMMGALRISEHTVQDHLKVVFDKVGVRSRRDLVAALMHPGG
jgi:DNA-binding CsgD family transcriptional regulator